MHCKWYKVCWTFSNQYEKLLTMYKLSGFKWCHESSVSLEVDGSHFEWIWISPPALPLSVSPSTTRSTPKQMWLGVQTRSLSPPLLTTFHSSFHPAPSQNFNDDHQIFPADLRGYTRPGSLPPNSYFLLIWGGQSRDQSSLAVSCQRPSVFDEVREEGREFSNGHQSL